MSGPRHILFGSTGEARETLPRGPRANRYTPPEFLTNPKEKLKKVQLILTQLLRLMEAGYAEGKNSRTLKMRVANHSTNRGRTDDAGSQSTLRIGWLLVSSGIYGFLFRDGLPKKSEIAPGK